MAHIHKITLMNKINFFCDIFTAEIPINVHSTILLVVWCDLKTCDFGIVTDLSQVRTVNVVPKSQLRKTTISSNMWLIDPSTVNGSYSQNYLNE